MLGQVVYGGRWSAPERAELLGLPVLRVSLKRGGCLSALRVSRAGARLRRAGVTRALVPEGFADWKRLGLRAVDPLPFLRAHAAELALAALEARRLDPARCAVALRAARAGPELCRTAYALAPRVRSVCVSAPEGGEALCRALWKDCGMAILPDSPSVQFAVRFDSQAGHSPGAELSLCREELDLCGLRAVLRTIPPEPGTQMLPLISALWEAGRLAEGDLKFT